MKNAENKIFIDTNCLLSYIGQKYNLYKDPNFNTEAIQYLSKQKGKKLYISSLAIAQVTATLQNKRMTNDNIRKEITSLLHKFTVVDFTQKDIEHALQNNATSDIEDLYQYAMSMKVSCMYIMTNNTKDFTPLLQITSFRPRDVRSVIYG